MRCRRGPNEPRSCSALSGSGAGPAGLRWPSLLADALIDPDQQVDFTVDGIGALPTGDTLIDTAGHPGPRAIGTLQKLGVDDPVHRPWLEETVQRLRALEEPDAVVAEVCRFVAEPQSFGSQLAFSLKECIPVGIP